MVPRPAHRNGQRAHVRNRGIPSAAEKFDSVFTGMYWAMTTITTTGYGDLVPSRRQAPSSACTMLLSIGVVAIPAGIFSAGFVSEFRAPGCARPARMPTRCKEASTKRAAEGGPARRRKADRDALGSLRSRQTLWSAAPWSPRAWSVRV